MFKKKYLLNINDFKFVDKKLELDAFVVKKSGEKESKEIRKNFMLYPDTTFMSSDIDVEDNVPIKDNEGYEHIFEFVFKKKSGMEVFINSEQIKYIASSNYENRIYIKKPKRDDEKISTAHIIGYKDNDDGISIYFVYEGNIYVNNLVLIVDMSDEVYTTKCFNYLERMDADLLDYITSVDIEIECFASSYEFPNIFTYLGAYNSFNVIKDNKVLVSYSEDKAKKISQGYVAYDFKNGVLFDVD